MKVAILAHDSWIEELVSQIFEDIHLSSLEEAEIVIEEKEQSFIVKNKVLSREYNFIKPVNLKDLFSTFMMIKKELKQKVIYFSNYSFYPELRICIVDEKEIELTQKESEILEFLAKAEGRYIEKNILLEKVWGYSDEVVTKTLETHIYKLKNKLDDGIILYQENKYKLVR